MKEKGYHIYVLSNASDKFYQYFERFLPFDYFDGIVVSADIKIIKPDRRIYEYLLKKYQLQAEECLFIDDRLENAKGAMAVGMNVIQFKNDFDLVKELLQQQE